MVAIPVGLLYGSFLASLATMVVGAIIACILVLPPWPMYNKHNLRYRPVDDTKKD